MCFRQGSELKGARSVELQDCQELSGYDACAYQFALITVLLIVSHFMEITNGISNHMDFSLQACSGMPALLGKDVIIDHPNQNTVGCSGPLQKKMSSAFFWRKRELAQIWMVTAGWSNCCLGSRMALGFPREFSQPIGFVMATLTCFNLFIFSPTTTQGQSCTKSEVMDSHLWWCFLWQADVVI